MSNGDTISLVGTTDGRIATRLIDSINNTGGTIALGGSIVGGTLNAPIAGADGTLTGVRVEGILNLSDPDPNDYPNYADYGLTITGGTSFAGSGGSGSGTINVSNYAPLIFSGSATINHVVINLEGEYYGGIINTAGTASAATTLTLGRQTVINAQGGDNGLESVAPGASANDLIINDGTINVDTPPGDLLDISVPNFVNHGVITLSSGSDLLLGANAQDNFILSGTQAQALIDSVHNAGGTFSLSGDVVGGTLDGSFYQFVGVTLTGVAFQGTLDLHAATLAFDSATSFAGANGAGAATITAASSLIEAVGSATLDNVNLSIGATAPYNTGLSAVDTSSGPGTFTIGAAATITQDGTYLSLTSGLDSGSGFVNDGTIDASFSGGSFIAKAGDFANAGTILLGNGEQLLFEPSGSSVQTMGDDFNSGSIRVASSSSLSLVSSTFTNGATGLLTFDAASGDNASLIGVKNSSFTNDGTLAASGTGTVAVSAATVNAGMITAGNGTLQFLADLTNDGTITATGGIVQVGTMLAGNGTVDIGAGASASLLAGAASTQTVDFTSSTGELVIKAPLAFLAGIAGFGSNDVIQLTKTAETGYSFGNGALTITDGTSIVASLTFAGSYTQQDFSVTENAHGNTIITHT